MNAPAAPDATRLPLSEARIADDVFARDAPRRTSRAGPPATAVDFDAGGRAAPRAAAAQAARLGDAPRGRRAALPDAAARRASARSSMHRATDGDARPRRARRHRPDDDRQLYAQRAVGARAEGHRGIRAARALDAQRLPDRQLRRRARTRADRGDRQAGDHADRHDDAQAHRRDRVRRRLFRLSRLRHRVHDVVHQGAVDRGRHPQLPVPRPPRRDVPRARRRAASAAAGLPDRHQHPAVDRDRHLRARLPARRRAGREELRPRDGRDAASGPGRGGGRRVRRAVPGIPAQEGLSPTCSRRSRCCTG